MQTGNMGWDKITLPNGYEPYSDSFNMSRDRSVDPQPQSGVLSSIFNNVLNNLN